MISLIISVLESYEPVEKYLRYIDKEPIEDFEFILVDDGSKPTIRSKLNYWPKNINFVITETNDFRHWTQPAGRNKGSRIANGDYVLMTDIDHVITSEAIEECKKFKGDKLVFFRTWGIIENDEVNSEKQKLIEYGLDERKLEETSVHPNTFLMKRAIFEDLLNGYDESFCGNYGGDDTDLNKRYGLLWKNGLVKRAEFARNSIYVYPDPRKDIKHIFHRLRSKN